MYKFNLQTLLNHRKFIEETLQKDLALADRRLADEQRKAREYAAARMKTRSEFKNRQTGCVAACEMLLYNNYIRCLTHDLDKQNKRVLEVKATVAGKRRDLAEAMKKRKMLDKLKERGFAAYRQDALKREQEFLNEVAVGRFNRKGNRKDR